jgi:hypothetical protein
MCYAILIASTVLIATVLPASAQQKNQPPVKAGQSYESCRSLSVQRGFSSGRQRREFIDSCVSGKQH